MHTLTIYGGIASKAGALALRTEQVVACSACQAGCGVGTGAAGQYALSALVVGQVGIRPRRTQG